MKKVFFPWTTVELHYQKSIEAIELLKNYSWVSCPWKPVLTLRNKKNGLVITQSEKEFDFLLYEKISEEEHSHCELCWSNISNFESDAHSGYKTENFQWLCNNCYSKIINVPDSLSALKKYTKEIEAIEVVIDGNNFNNLNGFYDEIENKLTKGLDWRIGRNLDAFNDVLRGGFGVHGYGEPIHLIWKNSSKSKNELGWSETIRYLEKIVNKVHPSNVKSIKEEIQGAKRKEGKTLFNTIMEIVGEHKHVEVDLL